MSKLPEPDFSPELQKKFRSVNGEFQKNYHIWDCQKIDKKGRYEKWKKIKNGGNDNGKNAHMTLGFFISLSASVTPLSQLLFRVFPYPFLPSLILLLLLKSS